MILASSFAVVFIFVESEYRKDVQLRKGHKRRSSEGGFREMLI